MTGAVFKRPTPWQCWTAIVRTGRIVLLTLVCSGVVRAQTDQSPPDVDSPGLVVEAIAGWDGTVDRRMPIPVSFLIRNDSREIITAEIHLSDPATGHAANLGEVVVAPGTARRVSAIQAMPDWFQCFATLEAGRSVVWRRELALSTGNEFIPHVNFTLFIDNSGRRLQLPGAVSDNVVLAASENVVAAEQGRPVKCLTVKSWQLPDRSGPLVVARAMVFPEDAEVAALNPVQWRAVAEWMCQGGFVFAHAESREIINRLIESAPLDVDRALPQGQFSVRRCGMSGICEYQQRLQDTGGTETRQGIREMIAKLRKSQLGTLLDSAYLRREGGRAEWNRLLVVAFFGLYTLFFAVAAFVLFRLSRWRIAVWTLIAVGGACGLSGLLGGYLRFSKGDLRWVSVTQAGAGGAEQVGRIEVQSAGGRNTNVAIHGEHPELQLYGRYIHHDPWNHRPWGSVPVSWSPNLAVGETDTYHIGVPLTPWGSRHLHATAFRRGWRPLDFKLSFQPVPRPSENVGGATDSTTMPAGVVSLKVVNHLPFDLKGSWLVIGMSQKFPEPTVSEQAAQNARAQRRFGLPIPTANSATGANDVYRISPIDDLSAGAAREATFPTKFEMVHGSRELQVLPGVLLNIPRISHQGAASAWIIGRLENSPILTIDEQRTDFIPHGQLHLFIQEIRPEDMLDAAEFLGTLPGKSSEHAE